MEKTTPEIIEAAAKIRSSVIDAVFERCFQRVENLDQGLPERVRRAVSETMMRHVSAA